MKKLDLVDYSFLNVETERTPMHVGSLQIFELPEGAGEDHVKNLVDYYVQVFQNTEPFNQRLVKPFLNIGLPHWEKVEKFNANDHVEHQIINPPADQDELEKLVARLNRPLLDRKKPLWKLFIIDGFSDNTVAIFLKIHHSCIDGIGGVRLMQAILDKKPQSLTEKKAGAKSATEKATSRAAAVQRRPKPKGHNMGKPLTDFERLLEGLRNEWDNWGQVFGSVQKTMDENERLLPQPYTAPKSVLNGPLTPSRAFAYRSISLHEMKELRKFYGATANDLVMAVCAGGLRRYLLDMDQLPDEPLISLIPVSIRSKGGGSTGNALSFLLVNLATHIDDPVKRLKLIQESSNKGKELLSTMSKAAIARHASLFSSFAILANAIKMDKFAPPPYNLVISNVPTSRDILYCQDAKLVNVHPVSFLFETQALNITIVSYEYTMDFAFIVCDDLLPKVSKLADYHVEAFEELKALAGQTTS